jgi:N utilization substance protein B
MRKQSKAKGKGATSRRSQRIYAFQVLYAMNFFEPGMDHLVRTYDNFPDPRGSLLPKEDSFAWELIQGVGQNFKELDQIIASYSRNWKLDRIARIELTILRLALYEMIKREDIPLKVAINEAVELSKLFGDENSRNFVNGILDAVARDVENGKFGICKRF